jgi:hypothetical protein
VRVEREVGKRSAIRITSDGIFPQGTGNPPYVFLGVGERRHICSKAVSCG